MMENKTLALALSCPRDATRSWSDVWCCKTIICQPQPSKYQFSRPELSMQKFQYFISTVLTMWMMTLRSEMGRAIGIMLHGQVHNSPESLQLSILSLLSPHVITPQCPLNKWYLSQECTLDPCQLYRSYNCEENGSSAPAPSWWSMGSIFLLEPRPAFIWVMLLNHVKVLAAGSWGTESRDMGHPVSYDHHTLGPTCGRLIGWSHQHGVLIGRWQPLRKGMEQTQTQGITRNTTNIVNSRQWRGDPGDDTQLWWQCGTQTSCEVRQWPRGNCKQLQELQSHFQTQVFWCEKGDWLYTFNERWTNSAIDFARRHVTLQFIAMCAL